ncbi:a6 [Musca autumnalis]|uniref:a6 n=1 Tax=Musca autumnalis TaxID=221902 RepID=UPI003CF0BEF5
MAPQQQPPPHNAVSPTSAAAAPSTVTTKQHSNPFYISAHTLCHNKRLKQKRSKYVEIFRRALKQAAKASSARNRNKTENQRRQKLNSLRPEVTIDLLSDDDNNGGERPPRATRIDENVFAGKMCLERAAILGLMPVVRMSNGPSQTEPPPLVPLSNKQTVKHSSHQQQKQHTKHLSNQRRSLQIPPPPQQLLASQAQTGQLQQQQRQKQQTQQLQQPARKRKSRPQRRSLPVLLNNESIVLSDDSDDEQRNDAMLMAQQTQFHALHPDLAVIYPTNQSSPCQPHAFPTHIPASTPNTSFALSSNTMQVDEDVTISLVPRSLNATACSRSSATTKSLTCSINNGKQQHQSSPPDQQHPPPPFPMLPDETTVHTVIANRIYELSLTKLREGLASCGIPEFNDGQQKISPTRRKGMVQPPPIVTQPQAPISLKLSSDLSISLISDDEDDVGRHHKNKQNEALLSPAFLQKLPVNVSIAPVVTITPQLPNGSSAMVGAVGGATMDPRKLKFG